jgi:hypothetical protein
MAFVTCATYTAEQTAQDAAIAAITPLVLLDCNEDEIASGTTIPTCAQMADSINFAIATKNIAIQDKGVALTAAATSIDFVGAGIVATNVAGAVTVTVIKPTALAHTWNALGDGSGTITLTFSDGSTLTAPMAAIPATC